MNQQNMSGKRFTEKVIVIDEGLTHPNAGPALLALGGVRIHPNDIKRMPRDELEAKLRAAWSALADWAYGDTVYQLEDIIDHYRFENHRLEGENISLKEQLGHVTGDTEDDADEKIDEDLF